jgi:hypothetical protein
LGMGTYFWKVELNRPAETEDGKSLAFLRNELASHG